MTMTHVKDAEHTDAEEAQHRRVSGLQPDAPDALAVLIESLGHTSWRVRKASLEAVDRMRQQPRLVGALIDGLASHDNAGLRNACAEALVQLGEQAVPEVATKLRTPDLDQRKFIVEVLGLIGTRSARQSLLGALDEADSNVRSAVIDSLGQIGGPEVVHELTARLLDKPDDLQLAVYVLDALARLRARLPSAQLLTWLKHRQLARFVYPLLGLSQDKAAFAPLVDGIVASSRGIRRVALPALVCLADELGPVYEAEIAQMLRGRADISVALNEALQEEDSKVAESAVTLLGLSCNARDAVTMLQTCSSRGFLQAGMTAVGRLGSQVVGPLLDALDLVDTQTQLVFLDAIEFVGDGGAVPELLKLSRSSSSYTAGAAMRALGRLAGPESIEPLMQVARSEESELVRQAVFALGGIGARHPEAVAQTVRHAVQAGDLQPAWIAVLGSIGRDTDIDVVIASARHQSAEVRVAAIDAARAYGSRIPETTLLQAMHDSESTIRAAAARALSAYRTEASLAALLEAMRDMDPWVVAEAAQALGARGGRSAVQALQLAANSSVALVAIAALQALSRLEPQGLESTLRKALRHADPEVVREALGVVASLDVDFVADALTEGLRHRAWGVRLFAASVAISHRIALKSDVIEASLQTETEPLVKEKLHRLLSMAGDLT